MQAGDTIWLRGGTYNGDPTAQNPFVANLNGTAANPIIVRQYPGERATLVGTANSVATLRAFGSYTWFWGFEVIGSASWLSSGLDMSETAGGKFINLVVHDVLSVGIGAFSNTPGGEAYGNVVYNCGPYPPHGSGYAFYINNSSTSATKLIQDNIAFSTASYGYHAYAPTYGDLFNMRFDGNAAFNIGLDSRNYHAASFLLAGNTVHQDRRFMARYMPAFDAYLHYRIVDVSTLKELARRWNPAALEGVTKEGKHEALADVYESIEELRHYRRTFLQAPAAED